MNILITGGAGYIGAHTIIELIEAGHSPVVVDLLSNSSAEAITRVKEIVGKDVPFHKVDLLDESAMRAIFEQYDFDAIMHLAGSKAVGESIAKPLKYYTNNLGSTLVLARLAQEFGVKKFIFSSSATVYGTPEELPLKETSRIGEGITNPYGQTKFMLEQILQDVSTADPTFELTMLRYFNPVGAHKSGTIGEDPNGEPQNLLPYISQVAVGKLEKVRVFGNDYETADGTGVRDYIHVVDLARGHVSALNHSVPGVSIYNLSTGKGTSVLELITAFSKAAGKDIAYEIVDRRPGDVGSSYASPEKANKELGWFAEKTIDEACEDSWRWQSQNPNGYNS